MVAVQTDRKPLELIFTKPLTAVPKCLQGILLCLQKFNLAVGYKRVTEMWLADTLSRAPLLYINTPQGHLRSEHEVVSRIELEDVNAAEFLRLSKDGLRNIQRLTVSDEQLQCFKSTVLVGWPETKQQVEQRIAEYWTYREEIGVHNSMLYKGDWVIVPTVLRKEIIKHLHASHQGEQVCLRRA